MEDSEEYQELLQKHRNEKKDLRVSTQQLKKGVNNCKKKKKEVMETIATMDKQLQDKQNNELALLSGQCLVENISLDFSELRTADDEISSTDTQPVKVSRAAKRRAEKQKQEQQREEELQKAKHDLLFTSPRLQEMRKMKELLQEKNLTVHEVAADGDCLYASISHQLRGDRSGAQLRNVASDYIRQHPDDFMPFLTHPDTGDLLSAEEFGQYCTDIADTHTWGGQPELQALSVVLERQIQVLQASGALITVGEDIPGPPLQLAYYRHAFHTGEHYNSLLASE